MKFFSNISQMEPLWPTKKPVEEKAITLLKSSHELSSVLHPITRSSVATLLELMNSYYSNLIEGNTTKPLDIERAQKGDYKKEPKKRALQIEAKVHIEVQEEFEERVRAEPDLDICSKEFLCAIHQSYYEKLPVEFRTVRSAHGKTMEIIPGELRKEEVEVGRHIPPSAKSISGFLDRFSDEYNPEQLSSLDKVVAACASHHRLAWIHPFLDGNGRVARLFTHLYFIRADIDGNGLWALSRGLARVRDNYYAALERADATRDNDYDGRGNLSLAGLNYFTNFLLDTAIDQVSYMSEMLGVELMEDRIRRYAKFLAATKEVHKTGEEVLTEIFFRGEVPRSEIKRITGLPERSARRVTDALSSKNLIYSETKLGPWRLNFTVESSRFIFPSLFPG